MKFEPAIDITIHEVLYRVILYLFLENASEIRESVLVHVLVMIMIVRRKQGLTFSTLQYQSDTKSL